MSNAMSNAMQVAETTMAHIERVLALGDLGRLTPEERVAYYRAVCESLGLNPLTRPFDYITLNGRLVLYARKDATDQLRRMHQISIEIVSRQQIGDIYEVVARATTPDGRTDEEVGVVSIAGLKGEALANAIMKATTKAKRRVTLSICGLGWLDETEVESIPQSERQPTPEDERLALERQVIDLCRQQTKLGIARWTPRTLNAYLHEIFGVNGLKDLTLKQLQMVAEELAAEIAAHETENGTASVPSSGKEEQQ